MKKKLENKPMIIRDEPAKLREKIIAMFMQHLFNSKEWKMVMEKKR